MIYVAIPFLLLGLTMLIRGWVYTLKPEGSMAQKRKQVNLRLGFTTDMKMFGRKVRRLGLIVCLISGGLLYWALSQSPPG